MRLAQFLFLISLLIPGTSFSQWQEQNSGTSSFLFGIHFLDDSKGWITYQDYCLVTTNGGLSWQPYEVTNGGIPLYDIEFVNGSLGIATSSDGQVYRSYDGGVNWGDPIDTKTGTVSFFGISFLEDSGRHTWIVGTFETIAYSLNNGMDWDRQHTGSSALYDVYFVDMDNGWAVGGGGTILHTSTGGKDDGWVKQTCDSNFVLSGVWFCSPQIGWIVGENGLILKTLNGGNNWLEQNSGTNASLSDVSFCDVNNGVAVGVDGIILHTKDGGGEWHNESGIVSTILYGVHYESLEHCWAIGESGKILHSQGSVTITSPNGGESWRGDSMQTITWESNYIQNIQIEFSTDKGTTWDIISPSADAAAGFYSWTPPGDIYSNTCKVRIAGVTKSGVKDESDQLFTIYRPDFSPPAIQTNMSLVGMQGEDIRIDAEITDESGILEAELHYRLAGEDAFLPPLDMTRAPNDIFSATISWQTDGIRGFQYYIYAVDSSFAGNSATLPSINPQESPIFIPVQVTSYSLPVFASVPENPTYQMISIPLDFEQNDGGVDSILVDDMGSYDPGNWRLFRWMAEDRRYGEYLKDPIGIFEPGKAFWIVTRKEGYNIDRGKSSIAQNHPITLEPLQYGESLSGWNQIGNPFAFPVSWSDILSVTAHPDSMDGPHYYNPEKHMYEIIDILLPWTGYFIKNLSLAHIELTIPPVEALSTTNFVTRYTLNSTSNEFDCLIQLAVNCGDFHDEFNFAGICGSSKSEWDKEDHFEPPPIGKYVSLYFPHPDWQRYPGNYTTDFRAPSQDGYIWDLVVESNIADSEAELSFRGLESVPDELEVYLLDDDFNISQNLRRNPSYSIPNTSNALKKPLRLAVGKPEFFEQNELKINATPSECELSQNFPNPFNAATVIRYGLPRSCRVSLKIYNVLGEEVAALHENELKEAGYHIKVWNARNRYGYEVSSGVYFYRLKIGTSSYTKKMLLVR